MHRSIEAEVPREPHAARRARDLLEQLSGGTLGRRRLETAKLLVSELVNNAVIHGRGRITLRASLDENRLHVEVIDEGAGFERAIRENDFDHIGGWGLYLVEADSARWGCTRAPPTSGSSSSSPARASATTPNQLPSPSPQRLLMDRPNGQPRRVWLATFAGTTVTGFGATPSGRQNSTGFDGVRVVAAYVEMSGEDGGHRVGCVRQLLTSSARPLVLRHEYDRRLGR
jgi:anti-sigma regulatory factor (Ser/Thr protein kinase)